jgi:hypothetical protein
MTRTPLPPDPFKSGFGVIIDADNRIRKVREFSLEQCEAALLQPRTYQRTVLAAILQRVRQLHATVPTSQFEGQMDTFTRVIEMLRTLLPQLQKRARP